jgi:hypothetical protein
MTLQREPGFAAIGLPSPTLSDNDMAELERRIQGITLTHEPRAELRNAVSDFAEDEALWEVAPTVTDVVKEVDAVIAATAVLLQRVSSGTPAAGAARSHLQRHGISLTDWSAELGTRIRAIEAAKRRVPTDAKAPSSRPRRTMVRKLCTIFHGAGGQGEISNNPCREPPLSGALYEFIRAVFSAAGLRWPGDGAILKDRYYQNSGDDGE